MVIQSTWKIKNMDIVLYVTNNTIDQQQTPYVYTAYYKYGDKNVVNRALDNAIPEFLNKGLLITEIQKAVNASNKHTISKERKCDN